MALIMLESRQDMLDQAEYFLDDSADYSPRLEHSREIDAPVAAAVTGKQRQRISLYNVVAGFIFFDVVALTFSGAAAEMASNWWRDPNLMQPSRLGVTIFALCLFPFIAITFRLYQVEDILAASWQKRRLLLSILLTFALMGLIAEAAKTAETFSRIWFFGWFLLSASSMVLSRSVVIGGLRAKLMEQAFVYTAISVGVAAQPLSKREVARRSHNEVHVVSEYRHETFEGLVGLSDLIADLEVDRVYITAPWDAVPSLLRKLDLLRHLSTEVLVIPGDRSIYADLTHVSFFGDRLSFKTLEQPIQGWELWVKRVEDVVIATMGLIVASPLLLLIAAAIKLDSPGPIFFCQKRTGFNGRTFRLWKFRSMFIDQTDRGAARQTSRNDPRVTRVGRIIRHLSLDELPQLINVIEGSMSVVGPRPHALETRTDGRNLEELVGYYAVRHRVKPGLTGLAQVAGYRGELDTLEKLQRRVDYDIEYINNWTLWLDMKIIVRTLLILLHDKSAY